MEKFTFNELFSKILNVLQQVAMWIGLAAMAAMVAYIVFIIIASVRRANRDP